MRIRAHKSERTRPISHIVPRVKRMASQATLCLSGDVAACEHVPAVRIHVRHVKQRGQDIRCDNFLEGLDPNKTRTGLGMALSRFRRVQPNSTLLLDIGTGKSEQRCELDWVSERRSRTVHLHALDATH